MELCYYEKQKANASFSDYNFYNNRCHTYFWIKTLFFYKNNRYVIYIPYLLATKKGKDDNYHPWIFYVVMMALVLTFMISNTVLMELYFEGNTMFSVGLIFLHVISPLLVVCDYVATDSVHDIKLHYFITGLLPTLCYTLTLIGLQLLLPGSIKSPYFFFDVSKYGLLGVSRNLGIISLIYTPTSFLLYKIKQIKKS